MNELPEKLRLLHRLSRLILVGLFLLLGLWLSDKALFPQTVYSFDFDSPRALKNTLTASFVGDKLVLDAAPTEKYDRVTLILRFRSGNLPQNSPAARIFRGYRAFLDAAFPTNPDQPEKSDIDRKEKLLPFPSGALLDYKNGVYIVNDKTVAPIDKAETLLAFGYSFADVRPTKNTDMSVYTKEKMFTLKASHPTGTVFYATDRNKYFQLSSDGTLREISAEKAQEISPATIIETSLETRQKSVECFEKIFSGRVFACETHLSPLNDQKGNIYRFAIDLPAETKPFRAEVIFERGRTWKNAKRTLAKMKQRLLLNYR